MLKGSAKRCLQLNGLSKWRDWSQCSRNLHGRFFRGVLDIARYPGFQWTLFLRDIHAFWDFIASSREVEHKASFRPVSVKLLKAQCTDLL